MKKYIISTLELWLSKLDPGVTFPVQRLNYKKCVESINQQSIAGRQSFYSILLSNISDSDKLFIKMRLQDEHHKEARDSKRTSSSRRIQLKDQLFD